MNALTAAAIHIIMSVATSIALPGLSASPDVYDALTSNRPYKRAYRPDIAYKIMTQCSCAGFDPELLKFSC